MGAYEGETVRLASPVAEVQVVNISAADGDIDCFVEMKIVHPTLGTLKAIVYLDDATADAIAEAALNCIERAKLDRIRKDRWKFLIGRRIQL